MYYAVLEDPKVYLYNSRITILNLTHDVYFTLYYINWINII
jgi:hypothetical protein